MSHEPSLRQTGRVFDEMVASLSEPLARALVGMVADYVALGLDEDDVKTQVLVAVVRAAQNSEARDD